MRKFDPWTVFFKREWARNWPFIVRFAITDAIITNFTVGLTDSKNSHFVQEHNRRSYGVIYIQTTTEALFLRSAFKRVIFSGGLSFEPEISSNSSQKNPELQDFVAIQFKISCPIIKKGTSEMVLQLWQNFHQHVPRIQRKILYFGQARKVHCFVPY